MRHWQREAEAGRMVLADWGRIVPPLSASTLKVFHQEIKTFASLISFNFLHLIRRGY